MQIVPPPQILSYRYKKASCGLQNTPKSVFGRVSAPDLAGGADNAPPDSLVGCGRDTPFHTHLTRHQPTFGARHASPRIPASYAYGPLFLDTGPLISNSATRPRHNI